MTPKVYRDLYEDFYDDFVWGDTVEIECPWSISYVLCFMCNVTQFALI